MERTRGGEREVLQRGRPPPAPHPRLSLPSLSSLDASIIKTGLWRDLARFHLLDLCDPEQVASPRGPRFPHPPRGAPASLGGSQGPHNSMSEEPSGVPGTCHCFLSGG